MSYPDDCSFFVKTCGPSRMAGIEIVKLSFKSDWEVTALGAKIVKFVSMNYAILVYENLKYRSYENQRTSQRAGAWFKKAYVHTYYC